MNQKKLKTFYVNTLLNKHSMREKAVHSNCTILSSNGTINIMSHIFVGKRKLRFSIIYNVDTLASHAVASRDKGVYMLAAIIFVSMIQHWTVWQFYTHRGVPCADRNEAVG